DTLLTDSQISGTLELINNIRVSYKYEESYTGIHDGSVVQRGLLPSQFKNFMGAGIVNRWDRGVLLAPHGARHEQFEVTIHGIPAHACIKYVEGVAHGVDSVVFRGGYVVKDPGKPVNLSRVRSYCQSASKNELITVLLYSY